MLAAVDPGRDKCGVAIASDTGNILWHEVIKTESLAATLARLKEKYNFKKLVIGNGTTSKDAQQKINSSQLALEINVVDEYRTTDMARKLYWKLNPPTGLKKLIPTSMQVPKVPVDDLVAVILAKRFLGVSENE